MISSNEHFPDWLNNFISTYEKLSTDNLELLLNLYHQDVEFLDPIHKLNGLDQLTSYFDGLYENLVSCNFKIHKVLNDGNEASIYWTMTYQHSKLKNSEDIHVEGTSLIRGEDGKVIFHRDYLDLGAMIYEQLPIIGRLIKIIKSKAAQ